MEQLNIVSPLGHLQHKQVDMGFKLDRLEGKRIAFLDNLKPQSDHVLRGIRNEFSQMGIETEGFKKVDTPTQVPEIVVQEVKNKYHAMVTGVGD